jgi:oligosaccharide repeat unit polymerase
MVNRGFILYSPLLVLTITWVLIFFLFFLNPFDLPGVRLSTLFILLSGLFSIYAGFFTPKLLAEGFTIRISERSKKEELPFVLSTLKSLLLVLTVISFIGIFGQMYLFIRELNEVGKYLVEPEYVRRLFIQAQLGETGINMLYFKLFSHMGSLNPVTVILAGVLSAIPKNKAKLLSVVPVIIAALYSIALLQRVYFVKHYILWLAVSYLTIYFIPEMQKAEARKKFIKKLIIFILLTAFFLLFVLIIRAFFVVGSDLDKLLNSFYFYTAGPIFLLDKYLVTDPELLHGTSMFRTFVHWFISLDLMEKTLLMDQHYEFYKIYNTIGNTFTYIRIPYEDFGHIGVIVVSYIWGWVGYLAVSGYLKKFSFVRVGFAAMVIMSFFWSFYGYAWTYLIGLFIMFFQLFLVDLFLLNRFRLF